MRRSNSAAPSAVGLKSVHDLRRRAGSNAARQLLNPRRTRDAYARCGYADRHAARYPLHDLPARARQRSCRQDIDRHRFPYLRAQRTCLANTADYVRLVQIHLRHADILARRPDQRRRPRPGRNKACQRRNKEKHYGSHLFLLTSRPHPRRPLFPTSRCLSSATSRSQTDLCNTLSPTSRPSRSMPVPRWHTHSRDTHTPSGRRSPQAAD